MDRLLRDMPYFIEVARNKSFTTAAELLSVPISTLSRRIAALEKELGVQLLNRNTRNVELTESGKTFFDSCDFIMTEVGNARERLMQEVKSPVGRVRLSLNGDVFHSYMRGVLSDFAVQYPDIELNVQFTNRWVDLLTEPFDIEVRAGPGPLPDSGLIARRLTTLYPGVYVSSKLMEFYPMPQTPQDLKKLPCVTFTKHGNLWNLYKDGHEEKVSVNSVHSVNSMGLVVEFLLAGLGAAFLAPPMTEKLEKTGEVIRLLPDWNGPDVNISLVTASTQLPLRVRLLADYLFRHFSHLRIG